MAQLGFVGAKEESGIYLGILAGGGPVLFIFVPVVPQQDLGSLRVSRENIHL